PAKAPGAAPAAPPAVARRGGELSRERLGKFAPAAPDGWQPSLALPAMYVTTCGSDGGSRGRGVTPQAGAAFIQAEDFKEHAPPAPGCLGEHVRGWCSRPPPLPPPVAEETHGNSNPAAATPTTKASSAVSLTRTACSPTR